MAAVPADSSGWLGRVLLQSPIKHPLPLGLAEFWWTRPWAAFLPMRAQENLRHVQHGSFESAGDSSAAQRRRKLAQGSTADHLWGLGLEHKSLASHPRVPLNAYNVSVQVPALGWSRGIYPVAPLQLTLVLTLPPANCGP